MINPNHGIFGTHLWPLLENNHTIEFCDFPEFRAVHGGISASDFFVDVPDGGFEFVGSSLNGDLPRMLYVIY